MTTSRAEGGPDGPSASALSSGWPARTVPPPTSGLQSDSSTAEITAALGGTLAGKTVASEVATRLFSYFTTGLIESGSRLPPERQLAASLGVGRSAVREALAALDILGIVQIRPGSGTYLRGSASELLPQTLSWGLMLSEPRTVEVIEVRQGLEAQAARLAAERSTADDIERMRACIEAMRANLDNVEAFVAADMLFHRELAEAADNIVLRDLLQSVRSLVRVWTERALRDPAGSPLALEQHEDIFNAIEAHDAEKAVHAMDVHTFCAGERLMGLFRAEKSSAPSV